MTAETTTISLDEIDPALAAAVPGPGEDEQRLAVAVLRLLTAGQPLSVPAAAAAAGLPGPGAEQALRSWRCSGTDHGQVAGFAELAPVLSFLRPGQPWDDDVMSTFCQYVLHFTSPATAARWTAGNPGTFVIRLDTAVELAAATQRGRSARRWHDRQRDAARQSAGVGERRCRPHAGECKPPGWHPRGPARWDGSSSKRCGCRRTAALLT